MKFKEITELSIAKNAYNYLADIKKNIDYNIWVDYINENSETFIWAENTEEGIKTIANINKIPESFRDRVLLAHNKHRCFTGFDIKKNNYKVGISYYEQKIGISYEYAPKFEDLKIFIAMAKHLNALLLKDGDEIIDKKVLESIS